MKGFSIPTNIKEILTEEGIWEDDSLEPLMIRVMEIEHNGKDIISHEMEFSTWDYLGKISDYLKNTEIVLDGYYWEDSIIEFVKKKKPGLASKIHGDSEAGTCVLWTENQHEFMEMLELFYEIKDASNDFTILIDNQK